MAIGGEVGVGGGACIPVEVEGCRLNISTNGQRHNARRSGALLRKGMLIGRGAVFELSFRRRSGSERRHDGKNENERKEQRTMHDGHPDYLSDGSHRF